MKIIVPALSINIITLVQLLNSNTLKERSNSGKLTAYLNVSCTLLGDHKYKHALNVKLVVDFLLYCQLLGLPHELYSL